MNYEQSLQYLYTQLPMFTRDGASAFKKDLTNTLELCRRLDNPQHKFRSVHVGGTNGKGSTSHMLAAILQTAGYKTGLYTSPHLKDFRERIRINGQMISEQTVVDFVEDHRADFDEIAPSFFEMTVALAFDVFAKEKVDIAVIEVGLGGRLDSTNVITPLLSVITNIGWDHMNMLGNTLQLIAGEKAGIIKPGIPVIIGEQQPEVSNVFIDKAAQTNSNIRFASEDWVVEKVKGERQKVKGDAELLELRIQSKDFEFKGYDLALDLPGTYQLKNVKTVLSAVDELRERGFVITGEHLKTALRQVKNLTGLHGRWETLSHNPLTICDTGHNPDGIEEVMKNIASVKYNHLHMVIGMVNDKDTGKVLSLLPKDATYYFCKPDIPRGLDAESMKAQGGAHGLIGEAYLSVKEALLSAQKNAANDDLVFVGGSTFVVAEVV
ncbi:bifunctional folylpolyglutamate synthase/dihydrofolate synthase [Mucilaginibacter rubeus]|uniref:Dihydrofolate synthase/folylpolyglutamate synthase n=1 Tax=Mucilaginibacter rubeus TaxID=2027860 RepID=A0AAE6JG41_9SPHI|nr:MULTISPECIES: folylpolyglutamate synthase/dihydrofolate synthase family protein [Mucilaginibacter]QEM05109.1 bifunctional folylpolyglutamate synthase/dihydrofolate synthase [Mucilaginibacter rubeus]QEM17701.1 bifunctional folylpolyglutamate synthase/dihydrofolate synthase [Mucilaginibacter gossypii]QTE45773.1 bifunctional folylpolyglutamate synthase/dihydrofolate synthase [Mucilaginibacter rubeus]QTE52370.1 bifunctional folylpolyglutamate synthase/dihydrofolate synthase [Mucilaginibacter rub